MNDLNVKSAWSLGHIRKFLPPEQFTTGYRLCRAHACNYSPIVLKLQCPKKKNHKCLNRVVEILYSARDARKLYALLT